MVDFDDRDHGLFLLEDIDLDAQLLAVRSLLRRNRQADEELTSEIERLDALARSADGDRAHHLVDAWVDEMHGSVYQGAANSMAAAGMLAPLIESMLVAMFAEIGRRYAGELANLSHPVRSGISSRTFWDPHKLYGGTGAVTTDLVAGLTQLAQAIGLEPYLPTGYAPPLKALFTYRNKMFHNGFEWPKTKRIAFAAKITEEGWPNEWFERATSGGDPWVFYMSDTLIALCLRTVDDLVKAIGRYVRDLHAKIPAWDPDSPDGWPPTSA